MVVREPWQKVVVFNSFHCILSLLCLVPVHGDELASIPTGVRRCGSLSFKSGYYQTGYIHPIRSQLPCQLLFFLRPCTLWGGPTLACGLWLVAYFFLKKFFWSSLFLVKDLDSNGGFLRRRSTLDPRTLSRYL